MLRPDVCYLVALKQHTFGNNNISVFTVLYLVNVEKLIC